MKERPEARISPDGARLRLTHGPIDVILGADGPGRDAAFRAVAARFPSVLPELAGELATLRRAHGSRPEGRAARAMFDAVAPHRDAVFVTPMAAVAGAVADAMLTVMTEAAPLERAFANNGGDIAVHLSPGAVFRTGVAAEGGERLGRIVIRRGDPFRGVATSGRGGRSHSLGIADAVTTLAADAAAADVAATLIANAVDLPGHPAVRRAPARDLQPDSDLGARPVVTGLGPISGAERDEALARGARAAEAMLRRGLIAAAALFLGDRRAVVGPSPLLMEEPEHA